MSRCWRLDWNVFLISMFEMIMGGHWEWSVYFVKSRDSTVILQFRSSKLTWNAACGLAAADAFMASGTCKTCKIYHWCALQDLLNNLESCDLDDDDLMLDVDVSEDASLHSGMKPSVWVLSATSVVEAATVPSKFLQMETPSPTWLSGEGDNSAGGCRKFMTTGGVGFTPIFVKISTAFWCSPNLPCDSPSDHQGYKLDNAGKKTMAVRRDANLILDLCPSRWF